LLFGSQSGEPITGTFLVIGLPVIVSVFAK
jgi:hypothetical protein